MFFEKELLSFQLLDVLELKQENVDMWNRGRNFHALSFRFSADTCLITEGKHYPMHGSELTYVPAKLDYRRKSARDELIVVHFDIASDQAQEIESFVPQEPERFASLFRRILACWNQKDRGYRYRCSAILYEILAECCRQSPCPATDPSSSKIRNSIDYIARNYRSSTLSIKEIARCSFMSEVYFRKRFKEAYGISPQKYIIQLRLQYAATLIASGYYSLKEIAQLVGYRDYKYFSVEFKRVFGVSPSEYRFHYDTPAP